MTLYFYRALNEIEIKSGSIISKELGEFILPPTPPLPVPFPLGKTEFMAMYKHQYGESYSTSGISVTSSKYIAASKYGKKNGVVVKLCLKRIKEKSIRVLTLKDKLANHLIRYPEDNESILLGNTIPSSVIVDVICSNTNKLINVVTFRQALARKRQQ